MHKKYNKFLIVSFIGVCVLGVYSYFYNDLKSEAASSDTSISSSLDISNLVPSVDVSVKVAEDTAFLLKLANLNKITVSTSLFTDQTFKLLNDNKVKLEALPYGRINPFSPLDNLVPGDKTTYLLKSIEATAITNKSAVLNGLIEGTTSNNVYFEYGTTNTLGKITPKVTPSLVGNFSSNITLLIPKTKYFYRATANVNGTMVSGEVMSFTTN